MAPKALDYLNLKLSHLTRGAFGLLARVARTLQMLLVFTYSKDRSAIKPEALNLRIPLTGNLGPRRFFRKTRGTLGYDSPVESKIHIPAIGSTGL